jgi:hypothetical protein
LILDKTGEAKIFQKEGKCSLCRKRNNISLQENQFGKGKTLAEKCIPYKERVYLESASTFHANFPKPTVGMSDLEHAGVLSRLHLEKKKGQGFKSLDSTVSGAFQTSLGRKGQF